MAETVVNSVLEKLMSLASAELGLLSGLRGEFRDIAQELESIQAFLMDAEERAEDNPSANTWVTQVRTIAYRIEDVVDEYTMLQHTKHQSSNIISKTFRSVHQIPAMHRLAISIKGIKAQVIEINRRKEYYDFRKFVFEQGGSSSTAWRPAITNPPQVSSLHAEDSDLVGIDDRKRDLIQLMDPNAKYHKCSIIAVVGMGGLGKTTLVRRAYKDGAVHMNFPFQAWITVSRSYSTVSLVRDIMRQFQESAKRITRNNIMRQVQESAKRITRNNTSANLLEVPKETTDFPSLIDKLRSFLLDKRYLVVFDDVWDAELWNYIKSAFPDQGNGSKIIVTTRNEKVAVGWKRTYENYVYKLRQLSPEEAWELFCNKAFQGYDDKLCPKELEPLSLEMVKRCEGLPLAIVAIGSLLSTKPKFLSEWQRLHKNLGFHLQNNSQLKDIKRILFPSYHDLPYYLKPCFLYFGVFPEDYSISRGRLIRLWAAEGFLTKRRGKLTAEEVYEVAEEYLAELSQRNLIQVSEWDITRKRAKAFRVHDLFHELILHKLNELSFCQVSQRVCNVDKDFRRLSILNNTMDATLDNAENKLSIRSFFLIGTQERPARLLGGPFLKVVHLLKVLIIEDTPVAHIPDQVGDLYHLGYLSIRHTDVTKLPNSIGKLLNLQTLDLRHSPIYQLPAAVNKLHKLQYLFAYWQSSEILKGLHIPSGILLNFKELQKLSCVDGSQPRGVIHELKYLKQLRKLSITDLKTQNCFALSEALENMDRLERLYVKSLGHHEILDLQHLSSPPPLLRRLSLQGPMERLPSWITELHCIVDLDLTGSHLVEDPLRILQTLPSLATLNLFGGYMGTCLHIGSTGFKRLKSLWLSDLPLVNSITIGRGGLPLLEVLSLQGLPQLRRVPHDIKYLENAAALTLYITEAMSQQFDDIYQHVSKVFVFSD